MTKPIAIFAIDPGTTSGAARGIFEWCDSVWEGLAAGQVESWEVKGLPTPQGQELIGEYLDWQHDIAPVRTVLVIEDFVVSLGPGAASTRVLLDPVRVSAACEALCGAQWDQVEYQMPSDKAFASNERLRAHGLWVKGSEHRRDAVRHLVKRYSRYVKENS